MGRTGWYPGSGGEAVDDVGVVEHLAVEPPVDELALQRLKKRRLVLKDMISRLEATTEPDDLA